MNINYNEYFDNEKLLSHFIELGVVNIEGLDEKGEILYSINEDLAREYAPELLQSHQDYVDRSLIELYQAGLINIEYNENLEATIHMGPLGHQAAREKGLINIDPDIFKNIPNN
ncbi:hypothetical protein FJZ33_03130 [Candidatus Poribacteria bacterium]|nr:hypothetical protein [Candidatus Poribacteria bacterium]